MSLAIVHTRAISGISALPIRVETDLANGLPSFSIVGLPDTAIRESRDRVRSAIQNSGFEFPQRRVTVNLAPADLPKDSGRFDLAIALGVLAASHQIPAVLLSEWEFFGELSLTGDLLPVRCAFVIAASSLDKENPSAKRKLLLPFANGKEAHLSGSDALGYAKNLSQVADFLKTGGGLSDLQTKLQTEISNASDCARKTGPKKLKSDHNPPYIPDWTDIKGQQRAKRCAEIATAGRHNLLMFGPPGVGKSMIASRMADLLPPLSQREACDLARIQSIEGPVDPADWKKPPFRAPHHTTPSRALIGGGQPIRPGEISLAHHGILFLDELVEFSRDSLEALREPLQTHEVSIARVRGRVRLPADFMLVAAMNPCPCGYFGARLAKRICRCPPDRIERYRSKISGPLLDRFDLAIGLDAESSEGVGAEETTAVVAQRVAKAHALQNNRQAVFNSRLQNAELEGRTPLTADAQRLLNHAARDWAWSPRAFHRVLRVARTIADLAGSSVIDSAHLGEAIELRRAIDSPLAV